MLLGDVDYHAKNYLIKCVCLIFWTKNSVYTDMEVQTVLQNIRGDRSLHMHVRTLNEFK